MTNLTVPRWDTLRTDETRQIESLLKSEGFLQTDAYRYNPASIRVRIIDPRFKGVGIDDRDKLVEPILERLPENTQGDIIMLLLLSPDELSNRDIVYRTYLNNIFEFDDPSPSML